MRIDIFKKGNHEIEVHSANGYGVIYGAKGILRYSRLVELLIDNGYIQA